MRKAHIIIVMTKESKLDHLPNASMNIIMRSRFDGDRRVGGMTMQSNMITIFKYGHMPEKTATRIDSE